MQVCRQAGKFLSVLCLCLWKKRRNFFHSSFIIDSYIVCCYVAVVVIAAAPIPVPHNNSYCLPPLLFSQFNFSITPALPHNFNIELSPLCILLWLQSTSRHTQCVQPFPHSQPVTLIINPTRVHPLCIHIS